MFIYFLGRGGGVYKKYIKGLKPMILVNKISKVSLLCGVIIFYREIPCLVFIIIIYLFLYYYTRFIGRLEPMFYF